MQILGVFQDWIVSLKIQQENASGFVKCLHTSQVLQFLTRSFVFGLPFLTAILQQET